MAQWIFLTQLQKARAIYLDAYRQLYSADPSEIPIARWKDIAWLDAETEKLVDELVTKDSPAPGREPHRPP